MYEVIAAKLTAQRDFVLWWDGQEKNPGGNPLQTSNGLLPRPVVFRSIAATLREQNREQSSKGVDAMGLQETFAQQLQAQIKDWEKQTKEFKARIDKAETRVRAEYEKNLKNLEKTMDQTGKMLSRVQRANEAAWKDMEASTTQAFEAFRKGWEEAAARYK